MDKDKEKLKKVFTFRNCALTLCAVLCIGTVVTSVLLLGQKSDVVVVMPNESSNTDSSAVSHKTDNSAVSAAVTITTKSSIRTDKTNEKTVSETSKATTQAASFPLDINKATMEELMQISGIGEKTAQKIIDYRYSVGVITDLTMLTDIDGIGNKTIEKLSAYLYVAENDTAVQTTVTQQVQTVQQQDEPTQPDETTTQTTQMEKVRRQVNINTSDYTEIAEYLLISEELAKEIVNVRSQITEYTNKLELLYADKMTNEIYNSIEEYVVL